MDKGHSVKAFLIYPEFPGCPFPSKIVTGWYEVRKPAVDIKQTERRIICCG